MSNSYSTGSVSGYRSVGGLVGIHNTSSVSNSYARGNVTRSSGSDTDFGGFCGYNYINGTIEYCYSTGSVYYVGDDSTNKGFVGKDKTNPTYNDNFFDSEASNQISDGVGAATPKTTSEMKDVATFRQKRSWFLSQ